MGDQDVFRAPRSAASAALSTDSSRGGKEKRGEKRICLAGVEPEQ